MVAACGRWWLAPWLLAACLMSSTVPGAQGSTVKKNFVSCCELVQEIGGWLEYQTDPRWKEHHCVTVMKDLGPCFSACKEIHHGKVRCNAGEGHTLAALYPLHPLPVERRTLNYALNGELFGPRQVVDNASPEEESAHVHHQVVIVLSHFSSSHSHVHEIEQSICANLMNGHVAKMVGLACACHHTPKRRPRRGGVHYRPCIAAADPIRLCCSRAPTRGASRCSCGSRAESSSAGHCPTSQRTFQNWTHTQHVGRWSCSRRQHQAAHACRCAPVLRYKDLFRAANHLPQGTMAIVANADVVFDASLRLLWPDALRATPTVFVLSVQPPEGNGYRGQYVDMIGERCPSERLPVNRCTRDGVCPGCSWDVYVFAAPLPAALDLTALNVHMNVLGAENLVSERTCRVFGTRKKKSRLSEDCIAPSGSLRALCSRQVGNALEAAGIMLINPCLHIKAQHWHCEAK